MPPPLRPRSRPRPHPGPPRRPHRRHLAGDLAAGQVLGIALLALLLGALINADALVARAEDKPLGAARDRSLALWHPVQDVAHVFQLHRLRDLGDLLAGEEHDDGTAIAGDTGDTTGSTTAPGATTTVPPRPEVRTPTAADPLRLWVGGDSIVRDFGESVLRVTSEDPRFDPVLHYEISTGLSRPDYFDWPGALEEDMAATDPEVVIIMFGANDGQGLIAPDGTTYQEVAEGGWSDEYARRVAAVMDQLRDGDRLVYWVAQPPMRDADFERRIQIINGVFREQAATRPWIEFVETAEAFGDADGDFVDQQAGPDGDLVDLRQGDGIHLAREGADLLADIVLGRLEDEFEPATPTTAPRTTTTTTGAAAAAMSPRDPPEPG